MDVGKTRFVTHAKMLGYTNVSNFFCTYGPANSFLFLRIIFQFYDGFPFLYLFEEKKLITVFKSTSLISKNKGYNKGQVMISVSSVMSRKVSKELLLRDGHIPDKLREKLWGV